MRSQYDEGLAVLERNALPVPNEVQPEATSGIADAPVGHELDDIGRLVVVDVVRRDELEPDRGGDHALFEVLRGELEAVPKELDDEVVARAVVGSQHRDQGI